MLQSPCEGVAVLSSVLLQLNPPPADTQAWLRERLAASEVDGKKTESTQQLLSTVLTGHKQRMGSVLARGEEVELRELSKLPLRFWAWTPASQPQQARALTRQARHQLRPIQQARSKKHSQLQPKPGRQPRALTFPLSAYVKPDQTQICRALSQSKDVGP